MDIVCEFESCYKKGENSTMKTTCVLFGAGADIPFEISGGKEFAFKVLGIDTDDMNNAIKKYFREKLPIMNITH